MPNRLRAILLSVPMLTAAGLFALYLLFGFFALPAIVKWQAEKLAPEKLGHKVSVGEIRFNPLLLRFEAGDLVLSESGGSPLLALKRLSFDLEWRSIIDRAWVLKETTLETPALRIERDKAGRFNFSTLLERLSEGESAPLPPFQVKRLVLKAGRIEFSDKLLDKPLVALVEPLVIEIDRLSTLPAASSAYRLSARTAAGEQLEAVGGFALNPFAFKGKLALKGVQVATLARALTREFALKEPAGTLNFGADFDISIDQNGAVAGSARDVDLDVAALSLSAPGSTAPLLAVETLWLKQGQIDFAKRESTFAGFRLAKGSLAAALDAQGRIDWAGLVNASSALAVEGARLPADAAADAATAAKPWRVSVANAEIADLALRYAEVTRGRSATVKALGLQMASSAEFGPAGVRIELGKARLALTGARLENGADWLSAPRAGIEAGRIALVAADGKLEVTIDAPRVSAPEGGSIGQGAKSEIARLSGGNIGAKSVILGIGNGPAEVTGEGLNAALSEIVIRSPADASELLRLASATLSGGALRLKARNFSADKLVLAGGKVKTLFDAQGKFNWQRLISGPSAAAGRNATPSAPWRVVLKSAELDGLGVGFEDRRATPAISTGLDAISARFAGYDSGSSRPMQVHLKAKVAGGGQIEANGPVHADSGAADLKLKLAGVALVPLQSYLTEVAALRLATGTLSGEGRLRYGHKSTAAATLRYQGSAALEGVLLEEAGSKQTFLSWTSVASGDVNLALEPNRLSIVELRVDQPSGRLIIAADQTVNLADVFRRSGADGKSAPGANPAVAKPAAAKREADQGEGFPFSVTRVRVSDGKLEFADLSLRPQFGARMHELAGLVTGLGSQANQRANLQLDARVDKYGSAKIRGQISLRNPEKFTDVEMTFRNLDMPSLSPYVAKFAGYRIKAGTLALDLQYKVRDGKLLGDNKIVLNKMQLGEKVDSPGALDLPLELAIAVLTDPEGRIDIGLPVSGDLNDPQFDYGAVIAKAFGNLIGGIITAPFRALGALFGGGEKQIDSIDFEPGSDVIAPPERQKLAAVARALNERPTLTLVVPPAYAAVADGAALKSYAVRADIFTRMGGTLRPGEDPGPVDGANPLVQRAIEAAFSQRYAPEVLAALRGKFGPSPAFYQSLVDKLIAETPVSEQSLAQLATRRGDAIVRELAAGGMPAARVVIGKLYKVSDATGGAVTLRLKLEAAK